MVAFCSLGKFPTTIRYSDGGSNFYPGDGGAFKHFCLGFVTSADSKTFPGGYCYGKLELSLFRSFFFLDVLTLLRKRFCVTFYVPWLTLCQHWDVVWQDSVSVEYTILFYWYPTPKHSSVSGGG